MKKGAKTNIINQDGKPFYFIGYSVMRHHGEPLLLLHTNPDATPAQALHFLPEGVTEAKEA